MTNEKHLEDLTEIRQIMERSTRFLSLSGWAGISAGAFALIGAYAAYQYMNGKAVSFYDSHEAISTGKAMSFKTFALIDAGLVLFSALVSAIYFSYRKALKKGQKLWTPVARTMIFHMVTPLISGGLFCLILFWKDNINLIAPLMLIFYGISLLNAGKYTNKEVIWLAIAEIVTGLIATIFQSYSLYFWALGFGVYHILYGSILYFRYDRKEG